MINLALSLAAFAGIFLAVPAEYATARSRSHSAVLDRIVAVIDKQPLLLSELELEARMVLVSQGEPEAAFTPLSENRLAVALEYTIGQRLAYLEAQRLGVFEVEENDVQKEVKQWETQIGGPSNFLKFMKRYGLSREQINSVVSRGLRASRFLDSKLKLALRASRQETTPDLLRSLTQKQIKELRSRTEIRVLPPFSSYQQAHTSSSHGNQTNGSLEYLHAK